MADATGPLRTGELVDHVTRWRAGEVVVHYPAADDDGSDLFTALFEPTF
jgi:hypothetical protein